MSAIDRRTTAALLFVLLAGMLITSSCYEVHEGTTVEAPASLIDQDKMVLILADVEVLESALRQKQNTGHEIADLKEQYYRSVFLSHEVTREQFDSSMAYYRQDMDLMNQIYEKVITRLSLMESELQME